MSKFDSSERPEQEASLNRVPGFSEGPGHSPILADKLGPDWNQSEAPLSFNSILHTGRKKQKTNSELLNDIVKEKFLMSDSAPSINIYKFNKIGFSNKIRNGIAKRDFSRSKLETFTREEAETGTQDLKTRIQNVISGSRNPSTALKRSPQVIIEPKSRSIQRISVPTNKTSRATSRNRKTDLQNQSRCNSTALLDAVRNPRNMTLDDFAQEKLLIAPKKLGHNSKQNSFHGAHKRSRTKNISFAEKTSVSKAPSHYRRSLVSKTECDFFPKSYHIAKKKDRQIVECFNAAYIRGSVATEAPLAASQKASILERLSEQKKPLLSNKREFHQSLQGSPWKKSEPVLPKFSNQPTPQRKR